MREPRSVLADCSPSTQEIASAMLDFPQPFGPTMAAMPSPWNFSSARSQNDLNPRICSFFSFSTSTTLWPAGNYPGAFPLTVATMLNRVKRKGHYILCSLVDNPLVSDTQC